MGNLWKWLSAVAVEIISRHRSTNKEVLDGKKIYLAILEIDIEELFGRLCGSGSNISLWYPPGNRGLANILVVESHI